MIKNYIAQDNKKRALTYLQKLKGKIELLATYPYLGKVNPNVNDLKTI